MQNGTVFKEYSYEGEHIRELDPGVSNTMALELMARLKHKPREPQILEIDDMDHAIKAELVPEFWGGHIGTTGQRFMINNNGWSPLPQPVNTSTQVEWYHRTILGTPIEFPVEWLHKGKNEIRFTAGPQSKFNFNWGWYFLYAFTIRIYYSPEREHATVRFFQQNGSTQFGDNPTFIVDTIGTGPIPTEVDLIGRYYGFDYQGRNKPDGWHYAYEQGKLSRHIGKGSGNHCRITWDTSLIPDQSDLISIIPRVRIASGMYSMGDEVHFTLVRTEGKRIMYPALNIPEHFNVRVKQRKDCCFFIPNLPMTAKRAFVLIPSWSGTHCDEIRINSTIICNSIGREHDYSFDEVEVPLASLRQGDNSFSIYAETEHHGIEINLPGPALFILF